MIERISASVTPPAELHKRSATITEPKYTLLWLGVDQRVRLGFAENDYHARRRIQYRARPRHGGYFARDGDRIVERIPDRFVMYAKPLPAGIGEDDDRCAPPLQSPT